MDCPLDYSLCNRTVTVYRKQEGQILRQSVDGCYLQMQTRVDTDASGNHHSRPFLLIMPGNQRIFPGDRVYDGIGPDIAPEDWNSFLPVKVPELVQVQYVTPCYWAGEICHVEAGSK